MQAKIAELQTVILTLSALIVGLCAYIVRMPTEPEMPKDGPHCPLHRCPPAKCIDRHKLDQ